MLTANLKNGRRKRGPYVNDWNNKPLYVGDMVALSYNDHIDIGAIKSIDTATKDVTVTTMYANKAHKDTVVVHSRSLLRYKHYIPN